MHPYKLVNVSVLCICHHSNCVCRKLLSTIALSNVHYYHYHYHYHYHYYCLFLDHVTCVTPRYKSEYSQLLMALISAYSITLWFWGQERREGEDGIAMEPIGS